MPAFGYRRPMSWIERLDGFQRRHRAVGFPIAVVYKYADDQGGNLAALVTYYGFVSLFPLLLLLSTILGFVLTGDPELQRQVLDSALRQFPVIGEDLGRPKQIGGGTAGLVVGLLGAVYGGLGVAQALQHAMNTAWSVPRNSRPNPIKSRVRSLGLLATVGLAVVGTSALTALGASASGVLPELGGVMPLLLIAASVALNTLVFALAFRVTTARNLSVRDVVPGAVMASVAWQALQLLAASYVRHVASSTSVTGGVFALVLGLLAFLYLASVLVLFSVEVNVVRVEGLYPRALLTPFTDAVDLTAADEDAYTAQAQAQRAKGFEQVDVTFGPRPGGDDG